MADPIIIQKQIKDNADDLHNFVKDLKLWEEEMKRKDRHLNSDENKDEEILPPVRKLKVSGKSPAKKELTNGEKKRIQSNDYKRWDEFDVDKACEEIDNENIENGLEEDDESAEQRERYLKEKALYEKELGNQHVKGGKWDAAIEAYSSAIDSYPKDPTFFANRALCYLKKKKWSNVETDCTEALKLDSTYVKAYLRRAAAREAMDRLEDSRYDLSQVLRLEPGNTKADRDLQRIKELIDKKPIIIENACIRKTPLKYFPPGSVVKPEKKAPNKEAGTSQPRKEKPTNSEPNWAPSSSTVEPVTKPPHLRSKKSLKRLEIHDIGAGLPKHVCKKKCSSPKEDLPKVVNCTKKASSPPLSPKAKSILTVPKTKDVPAVPKTSVQFHFLWNSIKDDKQLCYRFLKQIPGAELAEIFKESLESPMLSNILETLASECANDAEKTPMLPYLRGLTTVKRFSTLVLFLETSDKSNLSKLFQHCISQAECDANQIRQLQTLYEM